MFGVPFGIKSCDTKGNSKEGAIVLNDLSIGYGQKKEFNNKVIIEGRLDVENGKLSFSDCEIIFKQYGYIKVIDGYLNISNCKITVDRERYNNEKIIYLEEDSKGEIKNTETNILNNRSPGIGVLKSSLEIHNSVFTGVNSEDPGAVVYANDSDLTINKCIFNNCKSARSGGAITFYVNKAYATLVVKDSKFINCFSDIKGGAISTGYNPKLFSTTHSDIKIAQSTFENCKAKDYGGAIYLNYAPTDSTIHSVENCLFEECSVGYKKGGAIYDEYEKVEVANCCFDKCKPDNFRNSKGNGNLSKCILGALTLAATVATGGAAGLIIGGAGAVLGAAGSAVNEDYKDELHRVNEETQNILNKTKRSYEEKEKNAKDSVDKFISFKKEVYRDSIIRFANIFIKIKNIKLSDMQFDEKLFMQVIEYVKEVETVELNSAFEKISNIAIGTNTILLGGVVGSFAVFASAFAEGMMLSYKIDEAKAKYQEVKLKCEEIKVKELALYKIILKVGELSKVLKAVNTRFVGATNEMENNINKYGDNYSTYPQVVREQILVTVQLAQTCKELLEAKLLGEDGVLDERLNNLIINTRETVNKIDRIAGGL